MIVHQGFDIERSLRKPSERLSFAIQESSIPPGTGVPAPDGFRSLQICGCRLSSIQGPPSRTRVCRSWICEHTETLFQSDASSSGRAGIQSPGGRKNSLKSVRLEPHRRRGSRLDQHLEKVASCLQCAPIPKSSIRNPKYLLTFPH
jgi:hypothetical protein